MRNTGGGFLLQPDPVWGTKYNLLSHQKHQTNFETLFLKASSWHTLHRTVSDFCVNTLFRLQYSAVHYPQIPLILMQPQHANPQIN